jgi:hypothetical protein
MYVLAVLLLLLLLMALQEANLLLLLLLLLRLCPASRSLLLQGLSGWEHDGDAAAAQTCCCRCCGGYPVHAVCLLPVTPCQNPQRPWC